MQLLTIGQLAKETGVGVETIRFYEREGLSAEPERRSSSRYRQYPRHAVRRVRFIRHAKELGFTLREIQELLELRVEPGSTCADVRKRAQHKARVIEERIASLQRMKGALAQLAKKCRGRGPTTECPILEELDQEEEWPCRRLSSSLTVTAPTWRRRERSASRRIEHADRRVGLEQLAAREAHQSVPSCATGVEPQAQPRGK